MNSIGSQSFSENVAKKTKFAENPKIKMNFKTGLKNYLFSFFIVDHCSLEFLFQVYNYQIYINSTKNRSCM